MARIFADTFASLVSDLDGSNIPQFNTTYNDRITNPVQNLCRYCCTATGDKGKCGPKDLTPRGHAQQSKRLTASYDIKWMRRRGDQRDVFDEAASRSVRVSRSLGHMIT